MNKQYVGVTIGPITDTLMLTSSPAGLWGASYLFSWISRRLIHYLVVDYKVEQSRFVAPFFSVKNNEIFLPEENDIDYEDMWKKGIGLFHDRIIFCSDSLTNPLEIVAKAREAVICELTEEIARIESKTESTTNKKDIYEWLDGYIRIYAVQRESASPLLDLGADLSAMELEPHFFGLEKYNHLLGIFENIIPCDENHSHMELGMKNKLMKQFLLSHRDEDAWVLYDNNHMIKDLQDIAANGANPVMKHTQYYAVLKSDGDSMSKILENLIDDEEVRTYSKKCLGFCAKAAQQIYKYGGVPLYAGGDDLLALLPLTGTHPENHEKCTLFGLINYIRTLFNGVFKEDRERFNGMPTISFGISIQFYKSPLFEALERADGLLYRAKLGLKDACYLHLQKHSGQSVLFTEERLNYVNEEGDNLISALDKLLTNTRIGDINNDDAVLFLSGLGFTLEQYKNLFYLAIEKTKRTDAILENLFANLFSNVDQKQFEPYITEIKKLTVQLIRKNSENEAKAKRRQNEANQGEGVMSQLQAIIRLLHFMREGGAEKE